MLRRACGLNYPVPNRGPQDRSRTAEGTLSLPNRAPVMHHALRECDLFEGDFIHIALRRRGTEPRLQFNESGRVAKKKRMESAEK